MWFFSNKGTRSHWAGWTGGRCKLGGGGSLLMPRGGAWQERRETLHGEMHRSVKTPNAGAPSLADSLRGLISGKSLG